MTKIVVDLKGYEDELKRYDRDRTMHDRHHRNLTNLILDAAIDAGVIEPYVMTPNDRLWDASRKLAEAEQVRRREVMGYGRDASYAEIQEGIKQFPSLIAELNELIADTGVKAVESSIPVHVDFRDIKRNKFVHIEDLEPEIAEAIISAIEKLDIPETQ